MNLILIFQRRRCCLRRYKIDLFGSENYVSEDTAKEKKLKRRGEEFYYTGENEGDLLLAKNSGALKTFVTCPERYRLERLMISLQKRSELNA